MLGKVVDERYRLVRLLGTGGMGNVYEAVHQGTGKRVAVKVIANAELANDTGSVARFQREAKAAGSVETPHIAQVLDAGTDRTTGTPYIAMEFLVGDDLKKLSDQLGPLDAHLALRIVGQACAGLQKAHESGIVHRDIKPANLFLARQSDGRIIVKVLDFGIAKLPSKLLSGADALSATTTGRLLGSPLFMSPEQIRGLRTLNHRTDIWSLGAVLYQALAGRPPFAEFETVGQLMVAICSQEPPPVEQVAPWVRPEAAAIVSRALKSDPDERYPSAREMLADILALLPGGSEIEESHLVSASGRPVPTLWYQPSNAAGTQSLDDEERFLVAPPSPRSEAIESPKPRAASPAESDSTMPSASDGLLRPSGPRSRPGGRTWIASSALIAGIGLAVAAWIALRSNVTTPRGRVEPAQGAAEEHMSAPKLEPALGETPVAIGRTAPSIEAGAHPPTIASDRPSAQAKELRKKSAAVPTSHPSVSAAPTPATVATASLPPAPVAKEPEPPPPARASSETPQQESPWTLDRKFPGKKETP